MTNAFHQYVASQLLRDIQKRQVVVQPMLSIAMRRFVIDNTVCCAWVSDEHPPAMDASRAADSGRTDVEQPESRPGSEIEETQSTRSQLRGDDDA